MRTNSKPFSFADLSLRKNKITRTWAFLKKVNKLIDLSFTKDIHNKIYTSDTWRPPYWASIMFRIILLQQWYWLSDAWAEEAIYDRRSFQDFLWLSVDDDIPDETTIVRFRKALVDNKFDKTFFEEIDNQITASWSIVTECKSVDATITEVPKWRKKWDWTSTRDTDASFTKKNWRSYHWYKWHVSTDTKWKFIKACYTSTAKDHDSEHEDKVLDWTEAWVFQDSAYAKQSKKKEFREKWKFYWIVERAYRNTPLTNSQKKKNKKISSVRVRVEHPFAEIKCRMNFKARYRWMIKNTWQFTMTCAAYNLKRFVWQVIPAQKQAVVWCS
jgi:transposase, IS5 family